MHGKTYASTERKTINAIITAHPVNNDGLIVVKQSIDTLLGGISYYIRVVVVVAILLPQQHNLSKAFVMCVCCLLYTSRCV